MDKEKLVREAFEKINDGLEEVGEALVNPSMLDRYMLASAHKAIRLTQGILLLCQNDLTDESLSLLRSLIKHTANMKWIMAAHTQERLQAYMSDLERGSFGGSWTKKTIEERLKDLDPKDQAYFGVCLKFTYTYAHVHASSLSWDEVMDDPEIVNRRFKPEVIYVVTAQMLAHIMKVLDGYFEGHFSDYRTIFSKMNVDPHIGEKFERITQHK